MSLQFIFGARIFTHSLNIHVLCDCSAGHRGCPQEALTLQTSGLGQALQKKELHEQKEVNLEAYIIGAERGGRGWS